MFIYKGSLIKKEAVYLLALTKRAHKNEISAKNLNHP